MTPSQLTSMILALCLVSPTAAAVRGDRAEYIGGTIRSMKAGTQGILNLDDRQALLFDCGKTFRVLIPYRDIQSMEFGQKVGRRVGSTIALGVTTIGVMALPMLLSKKKKHFLTVSYANGEGETEVLVLEFAKGIVRTTIPVLEARTGKRVELQESDSGVKNAAAKSAATEARSPAPRPPERTAPAAVSPKPMTNEDVLALKEAGFTDEFLVAKIRETPPGYRMDTEDIVALKKANLSEAVIQTMMAAGTPAAASDEEPSRKGVFSRIRGVFGSAPEEHKPTAPKPEPTPPAVPPQLALVPVTVLSKPDGARILVDGYPAGYTPSIVRLQPGTYKLTLKAAGFPEYSQQITVEPGQVRSFGVALDGSK